MAQPELERDRSDAPAWERLPELALAGDREGLANQFDALSEAERIHAFGRLSNEDRGRVLALLDPERAALLLESVPDVHAGEAVRELEPSAAADILGEMLSDEGADLLGYLHADAAEAILAEAEPGVAANVRSLLQYPTDTAGGLMITEYVAVPEWGTAQDVIDHMRAEVERYADYPVQYVYVVGPGGELHGVLPLRDLLLARRSRPIASLTSISCRTIRIRAAGSIQSASQNCPSMEMSIIKCARFGTLTWVMTTMPGCASAPRSTRG